MRNSIFWYFVDRQSTAPLLHRPFGTIGDAELHAAALTLASLDHVLLLGALLDRGGGGGAVGCSAVAGLARSQTFCAGSAMLMDRERGAGGNGRGGMAIAG